LDFALNDKSKIGGVFEAVNAAFRFDGARSFLAEVTAVNDFRNTYIAHAEKELRDATGAKANLKSWVGTLSRIVAL
jgi:type III restriction enzyme